MKTFALIFILVLAPLVAAAAQPPSATADNTLGKAPKDGEGRFYNPWLDGAQRSFKDFLRWRFSDNPFEDEKKKRQFTPVVERPDFKALESTGGDYIVWLGHSTVFIKAGGKAFLTDPVFWDVNFFIKRKAPFPIDPTELPRVDFVLISHTHYDHLNTRTIEYLDKRFGPVFITGPGYSDYFSSLGITKTVELNWTEEHNADGVRVTSLPSQHWSKRSLFDTNRRLWASYLIEANGRKYYWIGDTGYFDGFRVIGRKFGPVDVVMAPIGSYEPRWFMLENHLSPEEAVKVAADVGAKVFIPIHWGTFDLTDEPLWMPVEKLREISVGAKGNPEIRILPHGGSFLP